MSEPPRSSVSRRSLLRLSGAAAVSGGVASLVLAPQSASAVEIEGSSTTGFGVSGYSSAVAKSGVYGYAGVDAEAGVIGSSAPSGAGMGVKGVSFGSGAGVRGEAMGSGADGVSGQAHAYDAAGVKGQNMSNGVGVLGVAAASPLTPGGVGVRGVGGYGVQGEATAGGTGVHGLGGIGVYGQGPGAGHIGVFGQGATGVRGEGTTYGVFAAGERSTLMLSSTPGAAPPNRSNTHDSGEVDLDAHGDLWLCVEGGAPGQWRRISGYFVAGSLQTITPTRVYDSRRPSATMQTGRLASGSSRTILIRDQIDQFTGAVVVPDAIPVGARAVTYNLTIASTVGTGGYLGVNPGLDSWLTTSVINWFGPGQVLANGGTIGLDADRQLTVIAGGPNQSSCHFIIDVTGFYR